MSKTPKTYSKEAEMKYVISRFEHWYSIFDCPFNQEGYCPDYDDLKKEFIEEMKNEPDFNEDKFDPTETCRHEDDTGWCFARYYEHLFKEQCK